MDHDRFDQLTRRLRLSRRLALPGAATLAAALFGSPPVAARCRQGRKNCEGRCIPEERCCHDSECKHGTTCQKRRCRCPAKQRPCGDKCMGAEGAPCAWYDTCCSQVCDFLISGNGSGLCGSCRGPFCSSEADCCPGTKCIDNRCGGCLPRATVCTPGGQPCCQSDCSFHGGTNVCLSGPGGECKNNPDCATCYNDADNCNGACVGGICQF